MRAAQFGSYIRNLRQKRGYPLRHVANHIDIDQSTLSKIERNEKIAPKYIVRPLADLFGVEFKEIQIAYLSDRLYNEVKSEDYVVESVEEALKRLHSESTNKNNRQKEIVIEKIKKYLSNTSVEKAWLFGSFAREEQREDSDIDLLITMKNIQDVDLLDYIGITHDLEDLLGRSVDLVQVGTLRKDIENIVEEEKVLIYD